ncbi:hypothetical protein TNCV_4794201 [Trichonephila clavipes]|nr:hypothetical protein TNCV_4794201 [Trichonephila clavipes]
MPRAHQAGFDRRSLADVGFFESVRSHGLGLALLTNGGMQQHFEVHYKEVDLLSALKCEKTSVPHFLCSY